MKNVLAALASGTIAFTPFENTVPAMKSTFSCRQHPLTCAVRRSRHVERRDPERCQRVEQRARHGGGRPYGAGLAAALGAERVVRARLALVGLTREIRQIVRPGQGVVHEGGRNQLAGLVAAWP